MSIFSNHSIPTRRLSRIISRLLPVHEWLVRLFDVDWWSLVSIKFRKKKKKERFQLNFRLSLSLFIRNKRKKIEKEWSDNEGKRASFGAEEQLLRSVGRVLAGSFVGYDDVNERQRLPLAPHGTHYRRLAIPFDDPSISPYFSFISRISNTAEIFDWKTINVS